MKSNNERLIERPDDEYKAQFFQLDISSKEFTYGSRNEFCEFGKGDQELPLRETMIPKPISPYALHKFIGELYCKMFNDLFEVPFICLRYFNVYGKRAREMVIKVEILHILMM